MPKINTILALLLSFTCLVHSQTQRQRARLEPEDGKIILSAWLDTESKPDANDRPSKFNSRIGYPAGAFQLTEEIPLAPNPFIPGDFNYVNMSLLDDGTDAALFLTVCM
ncbi:hypothetical protein BC829DRAFT_93744 [Chytridium lagenaria]|nr:hypothetical protein BC829DRAFT_93744 [Chytridium lagenaria]